MDLLKIVAVTALLGANHVHAQDGGVFAQTRSQSKDQGQCGMCCGLADKITAVSVASLFALGDHFASGSENVTAGAVLQVAAESVKATSSETIGGDPLSEEDPASAQGKEGPSPPIVILNAAKES